MDRKKLIGTIIGVVAFIILVAGATFAWFTYDITLNKSGYNFISKNFSIVYDKGTAITAVPTFASDPVIADFTGNGGNINVSAKTVSGSLDGTFNLYLFINTVGQNATPAAVISSGIIKYAVCVGNQTIANATYKGRINSTTAESIQENSVEVYKRVTLVNGDSVTSSQKDYHVYIWLDAAAIDSTTSGLSFSGYIGASATQVTD